MNFRILLLDDDQDDSFFFKKSISNLGINAEVIATSDNDSVLEILKTTQIDCLFLDYYLPGKNGLDILKEVRAQGIDIPIIMLTGQKNDRTIVQLMQEGATDYLSKGSLNPESLRLSIENSHKIYLMKKEKIQAEQNLRISEAKLAEAQKIAKIGNWEYDFTNKTFFFSEEARNILEYSPLSSNPKLSTFARKIHQGDIHILRNCIEKLNNETYYDITFRFYDSGNHIKHLNAKGHIVYQDNHEPQKLVGTIQDITILRNAINETKEAKVKRKATTIVFTVAILIFLLCEAILDPFIDSLATGLLIALSFKGGIALILKPVEVFLAKVMMSRII